MALQERGRADRGLEELDRELAAVQEVVARVAWAQVAARVAE
jgi:hypothetical protein